MDYPVQEFEFLDLSDADEDECHFLHTTLFTRNPNLKYPELPWVAHSDLQCTPTEWRAPPYRALTAGSSEALEGTTKFSPPSPPKKKLKFSLPETDVTKNLTTSELQRLLLLEQLKLTKIQTEKELLILERLKHDNLKVINDNTDAVAPIPHPTLGGVYLPPPMYAPAPPALGLVPTVAAPGEPVEGPTSVPSTLDGGECDAVAPQNAPSPIVQQMAGDMSHEPQTVVGSTAHTASSLYPDASVMPVPTSIPAPAQPSVITTMYHPMLPPLSNVYVGNVTANVNVHGYMSGPMNPYPHIPQQVYSSEVPHDSPAPVTVRNGRDSRRGRGSKVGNKRVDGQYGDRNSAGRHAQEVIPTQPAPLVESPPTGNANMPPQAYPPFIMSPMHHHPYQAQYYNPSTATHPATHHLTAQHATGTPIYIPSHPHMYPAHMYGAYAHHQPPGAPPMMPFPAMQSAPVPTTENSVLGGYQVEGSGAEEQIPVPPPTLAVNKDIEPGDANLHRHQQKQSPSPVQVVCTTSYELEPIAEVCQPPLNSNSESMISGHNTKASSYQQQQSEEEDYSNTNVVGTVVVNNSSITEPLPFTDSKQSGDGGGVDSISRNLPQPTGHQNLVKESLPSKLLSEKVKKDVLVNNVSSNQTLKGNSSETNTSNIVTLVNDLDMKKDKAVVSVGTLPPAKSPLPRDVPTSTVATPKPQSLGPPVESVAPFTSNHAHSASTSIIVQHEASGQNVAVVPAASHPVPLEVSNAAMGPSPVMPTVPKQTWASLFKSPDASGTSTSGTPSGNKPFACVKPFATPDTSRRVSEGTSSMQSLSPVASPGISSTSGDNVPSPSVDDPHLYQLGELLSKYQLEHKALSLQPRGLTNRSNWCYINSTLQALLACPPFYNLMKALPSPRPGKSATPIIDSMVQFVNEFVPLSAANRVRDRKEKAIRKDDGSLEVQCGAAFEPSYIYKMLNSIRSDTFKVEGRQEDAEEFLGCLLNALNDEMLELIKLVKEPSTKPPLSNGDIATNGDTSAQSQDEDDSEWMVMGSKNKGSITRRADLGSTPISDIFRGQLRSRVQRAGDQSTDNVQPFFTLQLDIEKAQSVKDALESLTGKDMLEGVTCSRTNQEVEAWQQVTLEELPLVLLLHLKWFDYKLDGASKIVKCVEFPIDLKVDQKLLSSNKKYGAKQRQYKLFAVVYHDGKEATKGHYITDVFHVGYGGWVRYDDSAVKAVQESNVLHPRGPRVPYLLYYRRLDTIGNPPPAPTPDNKTR